MKKVLLKFFLILACCSFTKFAFAQEASKKITEITETEVAKEKLLEKYDWLKSHLETHEKEILQVQELIYAGSKEFVLIETKDKTIMYDGDGQRYCTESPELNCKEYYKLTSSNLKWSPS